MDRLNDSESKDVWSLTQKSSEDGSKNDCSKSAKKRNRKFAINQEKSTKQRNEWEKGNSARRQT